MVLKIDRRKVGSIYDDDDSYPLQSPSNIESHLSFLILHMKNHYSIQSNYL